MKLSIIVPAYNEGNKIYHNLKSLKATIEKIEPDFEIILVSDGSIDNTLEEARKLNDPKIKVFGYQTNQGKGYALKFGVTKCAGEYVTFCDADMNILPKEIGIFLKLIEIYKADIVIGSKRHPQSKINYPIFRRFQSFCYQKLNRVLFNINVKDTQTGLKLFRREVIEKVMPKIIVKRFAFDLECLVVASHLGYNKILEAPVEIKQQMKSSTSLNAAAKTLQDTLGIYYRKNILKYYDRK